MIRRAETRDIDRLIKLRMQLIKEANTIQDDSALLEIEENNKCYIHNELNKTFFSWVIEEDGEIIAVSGLNILAKPPTYTNPTGKEGFIMNIYVVPYARGKGYATCLVNEIIGYLKQTDCRKVSLVATDAGRHVYEKIGFKIKHAVMEYDLLTEGY